MMMHGGWGWPPMLSWLLLFAIVVWAVVTILRRLGFSPWWTLLLLVPLGNVVGHVNLARIRWPRVDDRQSPHEPKTAATHRGRWFLVATSYQGS